MVCDLLQKIEVLHAAGTQVSHPVSRQRNCEDPL